MGPNEFICILSLLKNLLVFVCCLNSMVIGVPIDLEKSGLVGRSEQFIQFLHWFVGCHIGFLQSNRKCYPIPPRGGFDFYDLKIVLVFCHVLKLI